MKVSTYQCHNKPQNGTAKTKKYKMVETSDGSIVPRDTSYPLDAPEKLAKSGVTVQPVEKKAKSVEAIKEVKVQK